MTHCFGLLLVTICAFIGATFASTPNCVVFPAEKAVTVKKTVLANLDFSVKLAFEQLVKQTNVTTTPTITYVIKDTSNKNKILAEKTINATNADGQFVLSHSVNVQIPTGRSNLVVELSTPATCGEKLNVKQTFSVRGIPAALSIIPPLVTLVVAVGTRQVLLALFMGVYFACLFLYDYNPVTAFARTLDTKIPEALGDKDHAIVLLFSWMLSGMVAIISKSGGAEGLALQVMKVAKTSFGVQVAAWGMGLLIFFDDYANTLIVGSTLRPITDRFHISREKLAFLVDCTSAPVASIAPISSWIGFELSLIKDEFKNINLDKSAYVAFMETIQYRYYPLLLILFVLMIILLRRDFGPMLTAERKARTHGVHDKSEELGYTADINDLFKPKEGAPIRWQNGFIPIVVIIAFTLFGLIMDGVYTINQNGDDITFKGVFVEANSFNVLMWTGFVAFLVPMVMYWVQGIMSPKETLFVWVEGMKELMEPTLILVMAWTLGAVVKELGLASWLVESLKDNISTTFLPTVIFIFSALISVCTGSSWSTMSIMFPIVVELSWGIGNQDYDVVIQNIASILAGSVFGDHCSPISDTTVLSSLATKCDVADHVSTQAPYALVVGVVSVLVGVLPAAASEYYYSWIGIVLGAVILGVFIFFVATPVDNFDVSMMSHESGVYNELNPQPVQHFEAIESPKQV